MTRVVDIKASGHVSSFTVRYDKPDRISAGGDGDRVTGPMTRLSVGERAPERPELKSRTLLESGSHRTENSTDDLRNSFQLRCR